jgi:uncharacterized membrane protein YgcG
MKTLADTVSTPPLVPLKSRTTVVFVGLCYLFVGFAFSYLDRGYNAFRLESVLWTVWAFLGFGAGVLNVHKPVGTAQTQWRVMAWVGCALAVFPGFAMFNMLRWTTVTLMIVMGARASILRTRSDFYLTLTAIFVASFMVVTHSRADWTLWFYLGPAWVFGGLALAWDHAAGAALSRWTKLGMSLGFMGVCFLVAVLLFFFAPRPPVLGFGFLPPGTDTPGMFTQSTGESGQRPDGAGGGGGSGRSGSGGASGSGAPQAGGLAQQWGTMLQQMRAASGDTFIPQWQRSLMDRLLDAAQAALDWVTGQGSPSGGGQASASDEGSGGFTVNWLLVLLVLIAVYLLWRRRYRLAVGTALGLAWSLAPRFPALSMRVSAQTLKWCLHMKGHQRTPGQSVREHWQRATRIAPLASRWLGYAVDRYCEMRFGGVTATPKHAHDMRQAVQAAADVMLDVAPELSAA